MDRDHPLYGAEPVTREVVEAVAKVIGENSAAAQALREAKAHPGPVNFYKRGQFIVVEKLKA